MVAAEKKRVSISSKHQITIPQYFFSMFNFQDEAEFSVESGNLVLKPVMSYEADEFLAGLNDGVSGHPIIGLADGKYPKLENISLLDSEVTDLFGDEL